VNLKDNRIFEIEDLNTLMFRDSNLKSGDELTLKEPEKKKGAVKESNRVNVSGQIADPEGMEENMQGEDEEDVSLNSDELAIMNAMPGVAFAEGGEDELSEPDGESDGEPRSS